MLYETAEALTLRTPVIETLDHHVIVGGILAAGAVPFGGKMSDLWHYQLRVYLDDQLAEAAYKGDATALQPVTAQLEKHQAILVSQFRAFEDYVAEAEANGVDAFPLYRWTKATVQDPAMRARHIRAFAIRVAGQEVYGKEIADRLEEDLKRFVGGDLIRRMSRHDTNPANNIPVPAAYRA